MHSHVDRSVTPPRGKRILPNDFFAKKVKIRLSREGTRVNTKMLPFFSPLCDRGLSSAVVVDPNCAIMICISDFINSLSCDTFSGEKKEDGKGSEYCHLHRNRGFETGCFVSDEEEEYEGRRIATRAQYLAVGLIAIVRSDSQRDKVARGENRCISAQVYSCGNFASRYYRTNLSV